MDVTNESPSKTITLEQFDRILIYGGHGWNEAKKQEYIALRDEILKEEKPIIEDLIVAAHNNAKIQLKSKTTKEISKATDGLGIPGFKWPL